jgi:hypothetical protein
MPKICVPVVIENMVEIRMLGTVSIKIGFYILWGCAKRVIYQITIRYLSSYFI